jgi:hypothetical protein
MTPLVFALVWWMCFSGSFPAGASAAGRELRAGLQTSESKPDPTGFSVYVLSRGRGVPERALQAVAKINAMIEADRRRGIRVQMRRVRIGLEGETRVCVDYDLASDAERGFGKVQKVVKGVELVNLVRGRCPAPTR